MMRKGEAYNLFWFGCVLMPDILGAWDYFQK
jgi:hypothetical protein